MDSLDRMNCKTARYAHWVSFVMLPPLPPPPVRQEPIGTPLARNHRANAQPAFLVTTALSRLKILFTVLGGLTMHSLVRMNPQTVRPALQGTTVRMRLLLNQIVLRARIPDFQGRMSCQIALHALPDTFARTLPLPPLPAPLEATGALLERNYNQTAQPALQVTTVLRLPSAKSIVRQGRTHHLLGRPSRPAACSVLPGNTVP
jgi:hypothetical protein